MLTVRDADGVPFFQNEWAVQFAGCVGLVLSVSVYVLCRNMPYLCTTTICQVCQVY